MKKFRFPLRPVAILREHHQAAAREVFAAALRGLAEADRKLELKRAERSALEAAMQDGRRKTFRAADEISMWDAYRSLCEEERKAEGVVVEACKKVEASRAKYLEAHRAVKVIEKIEHKARTDHRLAVERESQLETDELAGMRVSRRIAAATVAAS